MRETRVCTPVELHTTSTSVTGERAGFAMLWKAEAGVNKTHGSTGFQRIRGRLGVPHLQQLMCVFYLFNILHLLTVYVPALVLPNVSKPEKLQTCSQFLEIRGENNLRLFIKTLHSPKHH